MAGSVTVWYTADGKHYQEPCPLCVGRNCEGHKVEPMVTRAYTEHDAPRPMTTYVEGCDRPGHPTECVIERIQQDNAALRAQLAEARDCLAKLMLVIVQMEAHPESLREGCRAAIEILEQHKGIGVRMDRALAAETGDEKQGGRG